MLFGAECRVCAEILLGAGYIKIPCLPSALMIRIKDLLSIINRFSIMQKARGVASSPRSILFSHYHILNPRYLTA